MRSDDLAAALGGLGGMPGVPGTVYLVGGGPGDPGFMTLRAATLLASADVVCHDRLSPIEGLDLVPEGAEIVMVGKRYAEVGMTRAAVDALMADRAASGKVVVRLKGGDPYVFGRGGEEAESLRLAGIPFEVVHGVTSAIAAPGSAGIPVTHRGVAAGFAVITGHEDPNKPAGHIDYTTLGRFPGTLLFLMGVNHLRDITRNLLDHGKAPDLPVALVRWGSTPRQEVLRGTLATIADEVERVGFSSPAVTVVGDVAGLGDVLDWRSRRPLEGVSVLVPRTRQQASALSMRIRTLGGAPVEAPTITVEDGDVAGLRRRLRNMALGAYQGVCLTSPNGARAVAAALDAEGLDARAFAPSGIIACVGPGTEAALYEELRIRADLLPETFTSEGLAAVFPAPTSDDDRPVLLPRADIATPMLADGLLAMGHRIDAVDAYVTGRPDALDPDVVARLADGGIDLIAFASSSTVRNFVALMGDRPWSGKVVSIGPVTSATCRELGLEVAVEADPHDLNGLTAALIAAAGRD